MSGNLANSGMSRRRRASVIVSALATAVLATQMMFVAPASAGLSYTGKFKDTGEFALAGPYAVTTDGNRNAYIADTGKYRIVKFDPKGNAVLIFGRGSPETAGTNGHLYYPSAVVWNKANNLIYVADSGGQAIQVFTTGGAFVRKWGTQGGEEGQVSRPASIAADCAGNIYAGNSQPPYYVQKFSPTGTFISRFGPDHLGVPGGIAVTNYSNTDCQTPADIIVSDEYTGVLNRFDSTGQYLNTIGSYGEGQLQFRGPEQLALQINGSGAHIWVAESGNFRVQEITTHNQGSTWAYQRQIRQGAQPFGSIHGVWVDNAARILVASAEYSDIYTYKDLPPRLTLAHMHNSRGHVRDTHALFFQVSYNQLAQTCRVTVKAHVTVPPNAAHEFTVDDTMPVRDGLVDFQLNLTDKQLGWLDKAWDNGRDVDIAAKATGCNNNDIDVSKKTDFSL
jgi:DNA-binding beta-propeller fold protein YncE